MPIQNKNDTGSHIFGHQKVCRCMKITNKICVMTKGKIVRTNCSRRWRQEEGQDVVWEGENCLAPDSVERVHEHFEVEKEIAGRFESRVRTLFLTKITVAVLILIVNKELLCLFLSKIDLKLLLFLRTPTSSRSATVSPLATNGQLSRRQQKVKRVSIEKLSVCIIILQLPHKWNSYH